MTQKLYQPDEWRHNDDRICNISLPIFKHFPIRPSFGSSIPSNPVRNCFNIGSVFQLPAYNACQAVYKMYFIPRELQLPQRLPLLRTSKFKYENRYDYKWTYYKYASDNLHSNYTHILYGSHFVQFSQLCSCEKNY